MSLVFDPLVIWPVIWALAGVALLLLVLALWRGLSGGAVRGLLARSEERRGGEECRSRGAPDQ